MLILNIKKQQKNLIKLKKIIEILLNLYEDWMKKQLKGSEQQQQQEEKEYSKVCFWQQNKKYIFIYKIKNKSIQAKYGLQVKYFK